jgi:hypothetical protein
MSRPAVVLVEDMAMIGLLVLVLSVGFFAGFWVGGK